jgi:hypothetical protein
VAKGAAYKASKLRDSAGKYSPHHTALWQLNSLSTLFVAESGDDVAGQTEKGIPPLVYIYNDPTAVMTPRAMLESG